MPKTTGVVSSLRFYLAISVLFAQKNDDTDTKYTTTVVLQSSSHQLVGTLEQGSAYINIKSWPLLFMYVLNSVGKKIEDPSMHPQDVREMGSSCC